MIFFVLLFCILQIFGNEQAVNKVISYCRIKAGRDIQAGFHVEGKRAREREREIKNK